MDTVTDEVCKSLEKELGPDETMHSGQNIGELSPVPLQELVRCEAWRTLARVLLLAMPQQGQLESRNMGEDDVAWSYGSREPPHALSTSAEVNTGAALEQIQGDVYSLLVKFGLADSNDARDVWERLRSTLLLVQDNVHLPASQVPSVKSLDDFGGVQDSSLLTPSNRSRHEFEIGSTTLARGYSGKWSEASSSSSRPRGTATASTDIDSLSARIRVSPTSSLQDTRMRTSARGSFGQLGNPSMDMGFLPGAKVFNLTPQSNTLSATVSTHVEPHKLLPYMFKKRKRPHEFFRIGKVFWTLWTEPSDDAKGSQSEHSGAFFRGRNNELYHSKYRLFIVVREAHNYCLVVPILSYGNSGVTKDKVVNREHGIVYSSKNPPQLGLAELGMQKEPIKVWSDDPTDNLWPTSRINYGKVQTMEHNIRVKNYGVVDVLSKRHLVEQAHRVWKS